MEQMLSFILSTTEEAGRHFFEIKGGRLPDPRLERVHQDARRLLVSNNYLTWSSLWEAEQEAFNHGAHQTWEEKNHQNNFSIQIPIGISVLSKHL